MITTPVDDMGPVMANIREHLEIQVELVRAGVMFGAGSFRGATKRLGTEKVWR